LTNAARKLKTKKADLFVANNITEANCGFGTDTNKVSLIAKDGSVEELPLLSKRAVADKVLDRVVVLLGAKHLRS
jgi:phosphopantothenoylcysteine decarboxylase/phosphopantothenate--cysteine ligase